MKTKAGAPLVIGGGGSFNLAELLANVAQFFGHEEAGGGALLTEGQDDFFGRLQSIGFNQHQNIGPRHSDLREVGVST